MAYCNTLDEYRQALDREGCCYG